MQTAAMVREKQINMRLSDEESARLNFLTDHYGINTSALFRMLLKKEEGNVLRAIEERDRGLRTLKRNVQRLVETSGVPDLQAVVIAEDDIRLTDGGRSVGISACGFLDAVDEIVGWRGSKIVGWDPKKNEPIVKRRK